MKIHAEIWVAAASLHEAGHELLTTAEIRAEVGRLFGDSRPGVATFINAHANGSGPKATNPVYNYIIRVARGTHRLCRMGDPVHDSRTGAARWPEQAEVDEQFWPLWRKWVVWQQEEGAVVGHQVDRVSHPQEPKPMVTVVESDASAPQRLAAYIRDLHGFTLERSPASGYDHMGAIISEAILQAGIDYRSVVLPRIDGLRREYPEANTTSAFETLLQRVGTEALLNFSGPKPQRVEALTQFFLTEGVETEADLKAWLRVQRNLDRLLHLPGVGPKTVDYLQILAGLDTSAVDRHLALFLEQAGIAVKTYAHRKEIIDAAAELLGVDKAVLDYSIWLHMSNRSRARGEARTPDRPWYWEGNVQGRIVAHLVAEGYTIVRAADTLSREAGKDIIARSPEGGLLWVSVKGFPERSASVQARHWFAGAVFDLLLYRGENPEVDLAIGLPSYGTYERLAERIAWLRGEMPFRIYWVGESGDIMEE